MNLSPIQSFKEKAILGLVILLSFSACNTDDTPAEPMVTPVDYSYKVVINQPVENQVYSLGDTLPLNLSFISETNEIVHNIKVEVLNTDNTQDLYRVESHVHVDAQFDYTGYIVLDDTTALGGIENWYCKGAMWSHEENAKIVVDSVFFKVED